MSGSAFAPFRHRSYSVYWFTALAANFGWLIQMVGASWSMTAMNAPPEIIALVQTSVALPVMIFSLPAGALADALGRRTTVLWSQALLLVFSATLAVFAWAGWLTPWVLLAFTFLIGSGKALNNPGWQTMVRDLVPKEDVAQAIAMNSVGFNMARSVGPAIGGVIVAGIGAFAAFAINAMANLGVILVALRWKKADDRGGLPPEAVGAAMIAGLRYVALSPHLLVVLLRASVFNFAGISVMALMPLIARDMVAGGAEVYGLLFGAFGVGAVLGAFTGDSLRRGVSLEMLVRAGFVTFGVAVGLIALSGWLPLTLLGCAVAGASWLLTLSSFNTTVQLSSPRWVLGRCHALYHSACFAGNALGAWIWGLLAQGYGVPDSLLVSGAVLMAGAMLGLILPLIEIDTRRLDLDNRWTPPDTVLDLLPMSGPVLTRIEYRIREADLPAFLDVMQKRRRLRTRDGARAWSLTRNMMDPELWTESYKTSTWAEHQRLHSRRTVAGAEQTSKLRALHQGPRWTVRYELVRQPGASTSNAAEFHSDLGRH